MIPGIIPVKAQSSNSFSISPPNFEINANPGDVIKNTIKVQNLSDQKLDLKVKSENFVAYGEGGQVNLTDEESTYSITKWLKYDKTSFSIAPHQTSLFNFTLDIPKNTEPGSHYGAVVFATNDTDTQQQQGAKVVQEIGALVLIKIPGAVTEAARLDSFAPEAMVFQSPQIKMNALAENTGSVHFKLTGDINIYDIFGNKIQTIQIDGKNILPGSKRLFDQQFEFQGFGFFKASLEMFYQDGAKELTADSSFFALNLQRSVPVGLAIIILGGGYLIFRKRINKAVKVIIKG
jgi:hypothetical protein